MIANTPKPPYYAVIFTTLMTGSEEGYDEMSKKMEALAKRQEGYLGIESARNEIGITVSYWENIVSIINWKNNFEHSIAQEKGRTLWYKNYQVRICKVERDYGLDST
jgi:heme-degrading monooxygenase HmoA